MGTVEGGRIKVKTRPAGARFLPLKYTESNKPSDTQTKEHSRYVLEQKRRKLENTLYFVVEGRWSFFLNSKLFTRNNCSGIEAQTKEILI
jgi:hypothetical protein